MNIKGYKFRGSYGACPIGKIISVSLDGAKFLTGWKLIAAHISDNITAPNALWLFLKEKDKHWVNYNSKPNVEPILHV